MRNPLSLVNGRCVMYFNGSVSAGTSDGYTLGLVRSQGFSSGGENRDYITPSGVGNVPVRDGDVILPDTYDSAAGAENDVPCVVVYPPRSLGAIIYPGAITSGFIVFVLHIGPELLNPANVSPLVPDPPIVNVCVGSSSVIV